MSMAKNRDFRMEMREGSESDRQEEVMWLHTSEATGMFVRKGILVRESPVTSSSINFSNNLLHISLLYPHQKITFIKLPKNNF